MRVIRLLVFLLLVVFGAAFALLNAGYVDLNYYYGQLKLPLSLVLVGMLGIGALLGMISLTGVLVRLRRENVGLRRKNRLAEEEVKNLRTIPLKEK